MAKIGQNINAMTNSRDAIPVKKVLDAVLADNTAMKSEITSLLADVTAIRAAVVAITAQLDADAGVTDTDYAANNDPAALTTGTPATLTTTS